MRHGIWVLVAGLAAPAALATQLTYQPINPNFGGNPLNGSYLLGNAAAQNDHNQTSGYTPPTDLERLAASLESRLLNQLFQDAASGTEGYLRTDDFEISVENLDGVLVMLITSIATGEQTTIEVGGIFGGIDE